MNRYIEIAALENGAHRNQTGGLPTPPDGWALIPPGMECENFPFGEVTAEEVNGVMTVTSWTPGVIPEPEEPEQPEEELSVWDELDAAYQEGVNGAYDE